MSCFEVQILEPSGTILEIESCAGANSHNIIIEQSDTSPNITISQCMALLPSDINDIIIGQIDSHLISGSGISLTQQSGLLKISATGLQPSGNYSLVGHQHAISDIGGLQIVLDNKQPSGIYASGIHNHVSLDITDLALSVSGLLPITDIVGGANIAITNSGSIYTVNVSGQLGLTAEQVDDRVSNLLVGGSGITLSYNDSNDTLTINTIGLQPSGNYTVVGHSHNISDISGLQNSLDNKQPSGIYASGIHYHSSSDITNFNSSVSGLLVPYALLDSPNLTGTPTAPTAPSGTNTTQIASTAFVRTEISNLIDSAPATLDTLNELAAALGDDPNFATTITNTLSGKANLSGAIFTGPVTIPSGTGNFNSLTVNGTGVSVSGHTHISSNITDFNSSVSGLLPVKDILGGTYISVGSSSGIYTINATGLQPSGNYSLVGHTHSSSDITDFNSSVSGLIPVKNILSGTGITVSNASGIYTIEATGSGVLSDQAKSLVTTVFNKTGSPIPKMTAVYINGGQGDMPTVALAIATADMTSAGTYGLTYETISNMQSGKVIVFGALTGLDTDQFNPTAPHGNVNGSVVYLSPSVSGALTLTKPSAPNHIVAIGTIVRTHQNEGVIEVRVQNGFELDELHNVAISGVTNGQFLQYNSGTQLWVPSSSGNFTTLQLNGTGVSVSGHTHTSSSITDFNSSVSGLLPSVTGSGYVVSSFSGNTHTISVTGLQPSGNYSIVGHTHTSSEITDFNTAVSGLVSGVYQPLLTNPVTGTGIVNHIAYWNSSSGIAADSGQLVWDSTNNRLGIGIVAPSSTLDVIGESRMQGILYFNQNNTDATDASRNNCRIQRLSFQNLSLTGGSNDIQLAGDAGKLILRSSTVGVEIGSPYSNAYVMFNPGGSEKARITPSGWLGIGTSTPSARLHVLGASYSQGDLYISRATPSVPLTYNRLTVDNSDSLIVRGGDNQISLEGQGGRIKVLAYSQEVEIGHGHNAGSANQHIKFSPAGTERVRITNLGNVGIGTTSPSGQLHVVGTGIVSSRLGVGTSVPESTLHIAGTNGITMGRNSPENQTCNIFANSSDNLIINSSLGWGKSVIINGYTFGNNISWPFSDATGDKLTFTFNPDGWSASPNTPSIANFTGSIPYSTGDWRFVKISTTLNQTGSAGFTNLFINRTETSIGTGNQYFIDNRVNNISRCFINNLGGAYFASSVGIGITSPSSQLHVVGTGIVSSRLGINTNAPTNQLHVVGTGFIASTVGLQANALLDVYSTTSGEMVFNVEGTNGSLFSVIDNLSGSLMSVNNNAGLPVFEVFSDDRVVAGRFNQNDFVINSSGNIGIGNSGDNTYKLNIAGNVSTSGTIRMLSDVFTLSNSRTISTSGTTGTQGNICWDSNYLYICIGTNNWKRITYDTW